MDCNKQSELLRELRDNENVDENLEIVNSLVPKANGWDSIVDFIEKDHLAQRFLKPLREELHRDQCYGYPTHIIIMIEKLLDAWEEDDQ